MKTCKTCKKKLPASKEYFHSMKKTKDGLSYDCKECTSAYQKSRYVSQKKTPIRPLTKECIDCKMTKTFDEKNFVKDNKNIFGLMSRCLDCKKNYNDPAYKKEYYEANKEKEIARVKAWRKANSDKVALARLQRSGFIYNSENFEQVDIDILIIRDKEICQLCMKPVNIGLPWPERMSPSVDHIVPLSKGGEHNYANTQLAHLVCNMSKGNRV